MSKYQNFEFNLKTKLKFGAGEALNLGKYLKEPSFNFERIGIIVDSAVSGLPYIKEIIKNIRKEKFSKIKIWAYHLNAEPDYDSLDKIRKLFLEKNSKSNVDCFIGIGGGSVIDFAKGLATLVVNSGKAITYRGFPKGIKPSLPTIALPTTAGTGSEVTYNAVFISKADKKKLGINTHNNFPVLAILDPHLITSCPKSVMVSSGMDVLTHILESYVACQANHLTRIFAREAFKLGFNSLSKILSKPKDIEILNNLQLAAYLAGVSLMNSGSGVAGALSYLLGVHFNVPHGLAGSVFLPYVVEHNVKNGYDYSELYDLIEGADKSLNKKEKSRRFSQKIFQLCRKLGVPSGLGKFGVNNRNISVLLKETENLEKAFLQNPILFSVEDGKKLLMKLIKNK